MEKSIGIFFTSCLDSFNDSIPNIVLARNDFNRDKSAILGWL